MACFVVPMVEAAAVTVVKKVVARKEQKACCLEQQEEGKYKFSFSEKLGWLNNLLWGGSALLAFEHIWHGEVTPYFPFLTAAKNAKDSMAMLQEMSTVGVAMAIVVTVFWAGMVMFSQGLEKKAEQEIKKAKW